jgi:uncharacterized protein (TIGR00725 family)
MGHMKIIGVMGSGQEEWHEFAAPLGKIIADMNFHLLTGGGAGVMTSVSKSFVETKPRKGISIGCVPTIMDEQKGFLPKSGYPNPFIEINIVTPLSTFSGEDPHQISRNHVNILTSDAIIALPGNKGTRNEIELSLRFNKPIALFGPASYFVDFDSSIPRFSKVSEVEEWLKRLN